MTRKKLLSALLALVFALSLFTALPVAAEGTVTATVNGTAIQSGDTIPAVSTLVFTLPNAIADLATVTFEEIQKGKAASGWATRLFDGEVSGNTLTVDFALGDLAMNSEYRFTFPEAEPFTFKTAATADSYYIYDNFDRYLENNSIAAAGSESTELDAPWWLGKKMYGRVLPSFVKENGDTVLRITGSGTNSQNDMMGSVSYDNAYAPAATGLLGQKFTTEVTFTVQGNSTSVFEVGGIIIKTTDGQTGLYYRTSGYVNGSGFNGYTDRPSIDERITSLNYSVAAPTDQKVQHTIKFIQSTNVTYPYRKTFYKLWFDGNEVPLPANGITVTWESSEMSEDPTNFSGATGLAHLFSATNNCASGSEAAGESVSTVMDVHSFSYRDFVPDPVTVSATTESGTVISPVGSLTFTFSEAVDAADLATGLIFEEDKLGSGDWSKRVCSYDLAGKNLTVTFDEGDLASDSNYRFRFTTGIVTEETVFNYKTDATSNYYINDNFDRFPENNSITGSLPVYTGQAELDAPWWLGKKQYSRVVPSFVKENGDTVLRITSGGADTEDDMFGSVSYDNAYAPAVTGLESHKTVTEVEFTVQGNASSVFEIGGIIIKTTDGQTGLYYRKSGYVNGSGFVSYADRPSIDERITSLNYSVAAPTDQKVRHTIKFIQSSNCVWPCNKTFYKLWFDGNEVPLPNGKISVSLEATEMTEDPVNYSGATGLAHLFSATNNWATSNEQPGISVRTVMDIHSYKYGPVGVKVTVADGAAANSKAITFTNNSGEDINNAVIVLAVYTNDGKTFVGFDGLTENVSVENAESVTVTRTVANAAAGNTYKVIILNSKANLQPICDVASGAIG